MVKLETIFAVLACVSLAAAENDTTTNGTTNGTTTETKVCEAWRTGGGGGNPRMILKMIRYAKTIP